MFMLKKKIRDVNLKKDEDVWIKGAEKTGVDL